MKNSPSEIRWFMLDGVLVAATPVGTFALGDAGWAPSNTADMFANGREISEEAARVGWGADLDRAGPPPQAAKQPFASAPALAMARAAQRVGEKFDDPGLKKAGEGLEARALEAIKQGKTKLDPLN